MPEAASHAPPLPLLTYQGTVLPEWVDYNGHLRDAFYSLLFSYGVDGLMDRIGLDAAGRAALSHSLFTLEAHIHYLREVKLGASLEVRTQVVAIDAKRLHVALALHVPGVDGAAATGEQMLLNMDMRGPRSAPFAPEVLALLQPLAAQHATLPRPARLGSVIGLPPKK
jgi:acyl-CoA thioester hydrolase